MPYAPPTDPAHPTIVHGEALATMREIPDGCVHLILVDPPYFRVKGEAWDNQWDTAAGFLAWVRELAVEWRRILAPNGSLYVFASPQMSARVEVTIGEVFAVLNSIVWAKPAFSTKAEMFDKSICRAYFPASERVIFAEHKGADSMAMGESGYEAQCAGLRASVFEPLRAYLDNERVRAGWTVRGVAEAYQRKTGSRTVTGMAGHWFGRTCALPTAENLDWLRSLFGSEFLRREYDDLRREYDDLRRPFTVSSAVPYTDVWTYPTVAKYPGKHPCEKPREMIADMIRASSRPGDHVLDCFLGSGVTGEQAVSLGRRFTGVEMGDYIHGARRRIANAIGSPEAAAEANEHAPKGGQLGLL